MLLCLQNVLEELDTDREWFYSKAQRVLYYKPSSNWTDPLAQLDAAEFVAIEADARVLVNVSGSQAEPVRDLTIRGLTFRDTAVSYFEPHALPSGSLSCKRSRLCDRRMRFFARVWPKPAD
eukprot:SAG31_NODE_4182_length_3495_cov_1.750294_2_plen_121_part_00